MIATLPVFYDDRTGNEVKAFYLYIRDKCKNKKIYYVRLRDRNGKKINMTFSTHLTNYDDAEKWVISNYDKLIDEYIESMKYRKGRSNKILHTSLQEYFKIGSNWLKLDKEFGIERLEKGNKEYDSLVKRVLIPYLNEYKIFDYSDLTPKVLYEFQKDCILKNISNKNITDILFAINLLYNRLSIEGKVAYNPLASIRCVKREKSKIKGMFDIKDIKGLFNMEWIGNETEYMFNLISATTGMRNSEIRLLKVCDFEKVKDIHFINISNARDDESKEAKNEYSLRKVPLHNFVYDKIINYISKNQRTKYIFVNEKKHVYKACEISNMINIVSNKLGFSDNYCSDNNITFHSWRHMYSTIMYESGVIYSDWIEYFLGHKQNGVKAIYTHLNNVDGKDASEKALSIIESNYL